MQLFVNAMLLSLTGQRAIQNCIQRMDMQSRQSRCPNNSTTCKIKSYFVRSFIFQLRQSNLLYTRKRPNYFETFRAFKRAEFIIFVLIQILRFFCGNILAKFCKLGAISEKHWVSSQSREKDSNSFSMVYVIFIIKEEYFIF